MTTPQSNATPKTSTPSYLVLAFFLLLTATLSLIWSHVRFMWYDEFLSFYTDGVATFKQVFLVQLHHPISLDPPTYHLLSHLCMNILGRNAIALRLPALAGFLLFQLCLFFFVRRLAGDRSAIIAIAVPLLTASFRYSVEGRPYGLLLGLYALSLLCWQTATLDDPPTVAPPRSRILPLTVLTLSIALAITSHYFGVLILIPVSLGELSRTLTRKRLDLGVLTALALGLASVVLILPFQRALMVYRQHYYITGVTIRDIRLGYYALFLRESSGPILLAKLIEVIFVVLVLALAVAGYQRFKRRPSTEHAYTWVALASMALLPFFGYLFGRFVTHTMEVRYVIAALIAFAATFGIDLERKLRSNTFYYATLTLIVTGAIALNAWNIVNERRVSNEILAGFQLTPEAAAAVHQNPHELIYIQSFNDFFLNTYYEPDPALRSRFSLLYGQEQEIRWLHHDTLSITATNLHTFAPGIMTSYADFVKQPHPLLILRYGLESWPYKQLNADHTPVTPIAECLGGKLVRVANPPISVK
jgi:Dolichyl-phosphate-mannose-protein mannosyltransferase